MFTQLKTKNELYSIALRDGTLPLKHRVSTRGGTAQLQAVRQQWALSGWWWATRKRDDGGGGDVACAGSGGGSGVLNIREQKLHSACSVRLDSVTGTPVWVGEVSTSDAKPCNVAPIAQ
jgi:hypothetical protein